MGIRSLTSCPRRVERIYGMASAIHSIHSIVLLVMTSLFCVGVTCDKIESSSSFVCKDTTNCTTITPELCKRFPPLKDVCAGTCAFCKCEDKVDCMGVSNIACEFHSFIRDKCHKTCGVCQDRDINKCDPNPCVHGKCTDLPDGLGDYTCNCEQGWEGLNCDDRPTTRCKSLLSDHTCPGSGYIPLADASSLEACPSECEKAGDGAVGCCVWQHDWKKCLWYADTQTIQDHVNGYRSAVSCT